MTPPITAPFTLDVIIQEIRHIIAHSDPENIEDITKHVQGILPTEDTQVKLQAGSDDEDKKIMMAFFVDQVKKQGQFQSLAELLERLLLKTPVDKLETLGRILAHTQTLEGSKYEWGASKPVWSEGAQGYSCYFFIYKH